MTVKLVIDAVYTNTWEILTTYAVQSKLKKRSKRENLKEISQQEEDKTRTRFDLTLFFLLERERAVLMPSGVGLLEGAEEASRTAEEEFRPISGWFDSCFTSIEKRYLLLSWG